MSTVKSGSDNDTQQSTENQKKKSVDLTFGVFFDGTLNSIANIDERKSFKEFQKNLDMFTLLLNLDALVDRTKKMNNNSSYDSYRNEYTNVARFYKCSKKNNNIIPIYIEGIGTKPRLIGEKVDFKKPVRESENFYEKYRTLDQYSLDQFIKDNQKFLTCSDDQLGSALGVGLFGVKKKVESACEKIFKKIKNRKDLSHGTEVKLKFYVFGFSRGSAAARCFSACLEKRLGTTKVESSFNSNFIGTKNFMSVKYRLEKENTYKTSLKSDWLKKYLNDNGISLTEAKVEFLGLYDTVSSYGAYFDDDVDELSLKINNNVNNVYQICAGDEYRKNFALTDITSATGKGDYIIIPGAHSDIGGGYAQNIKESLRSWGFSSGHKGKSLLLSEGWFKPDEDSRVISNLYSVIPFNLMKEKITERDTMFDSNKFNRYVLPPSGKKKIDRVEHKASKALNEFFKKLKAGDYNSYYRLEGNTIKSLSKEESDLTNQISRIDKNISYLESENAYYESIRMMENLKKEDQKKLNEVKQKKANYDEDLLKQIRHDFLHLSAKSAELKDIFVNKSDTNNNRTVIKG